VRSDRTARPSSGSGRAAIVLAVILVGCSSRFEDKWSRSRPPTHPASGLVLAEGSPVAGATVVFHPAGNGTASPRSAVGMTGTDGRFRLKTFRDGDGAVAGSYIVTIEKLAWIQPATGHHPEEWAPPVEQTLLPARYRVVATSGLTAEVTADAPNESVFVLQVSGGE